MSNDASNDDPSDTEGADTESPEAPDSIKEADRANGEGDPEE